MSKPTKYKDKRDGAYVDAWQVPARCTATMYKPRWVQVAIDQRKLLMDLSPPSPSDASPIVGFVLRGLLVKAGDWLVRVEDKTQHHCYRVEQCASDVFSSAFEPVPSDSLVAIPEPIEHPMTEPLYEDKKRQFKTVRAWRIVPSELTLDRDVPSWVREAIKSRSIVVNLHGEILVVATSTTGMQSDWLVMGEAPDLTFGYCVFTDKAFNDRFVPFEFKAMEPQAVIHAAIGSMCARLHDCVQACEALSRSIERGDGFARELYDALHKHFGGSDAGSTPVPRIDT